MSSAHLKCFSGHSFLPCKVHGHHGAHRESDTGDQQQWPLPGLDGRRVADADELHHLAVQAASLVALVMCVGVHTSIPRHGGNCASAGTRA